MSITPFSGLDPISHSLFWSMLVNLGLYVGVSLLTRQSMVERGQAVLFVDVFRRAAGGSRVWRGTATVRDLRDLVARFIGQNRSDVTFAAHARSRGLSLIENSQADAEWVHFA